VAGYTSTVHIPITVPGSGSPAPAIALGELAINPPTTNITATKAAKTTNPTRPAFFLIAFPP
jgi:hypothetical protein